MKKIVLKLDLHDNREKQKALKSVATFSGIDSIGMDMKEKKLTVIGSVDPVTIVSKLRKNWPTTNIISVGPVEEPKKKEEPKKEGGDPQPKKEEEAKKDGAGEAKKDGKDEPKKEEGAKKEEEGKKDGGGEKKDGEKKDAAQPAAAPQPRPQFLPQPLYPYVQPQPMYPYPQPHPDPRVMELVKAYRSYNPRHTTHYYVQSMEENPNACVIC